ncbi:CARDB domain-containing protein [Pseudaestuariivita sp.]|uniref:CARDB domain-containing protein n=1 Tax=Pseudaestuariivita sp. TaxID=2211669 RepID=UPI004058209B
MGLFGGTPDIEVEDIWFSSLFGGEIAKGDRITLNTTIRNSGNADANGITVKYYIDDDYIGKDSIGRIGTIVRENDESIRWTVDRDGAFKVTVEVELDEDEKSTKNNDRTETFYAVEKGSDIVVEDISLHNLTGRLREGKVVTIKTDLDNLGNDHSGLGGFNLTYYANGEEIGSERVAAGLAPGQNWSQYFLWTVDQTGPVEISAKVSGVGNETDYDNNSHAETFFVEEPDVAVHDIRVIDTGGRGGKMEIHAEIANIGGSDTFDEDAFHVRYDINGERYGTKLVDKIDVGDTVERMLEVDVGDDQIDSIRVYVENVEGDAKAANNSRTEGGFHVRPSDPEEDAAHDLGTASEDILVATQAAHAIYGDGRLAEDFRGDDADDNGRDDDYDEWFDAGGWQVLDEGDLGALMPDGHDDIRWHQGGLYEGRYGGGWYAQSLLARSHDVEGDEEAPDTLLLVFRGTDDKDLPASSVGGQAWTGNGQFNYYEAQRPMIEAALAYANDDANGIGKLIVTGHSLGGATADIFAAVDAQRLDPEVELRVVSLASAGIDPDTLEDNYDKTYLIDDKGYLGQVDTSVVQITGGNARLVSPDWYIGLSMSEDRVTFDIDGPDSGMVGNGTLEENLHFTGQLTKVDLPSIDNLQIDNGKTLYKRGFGAEHDPGLYAAIISDIARDPLTAFYDGETVIAGRTDLGEVADLRGEVFALMPDADGLSDSDDDGDNALTGSDGADFILGLGGNDALDGKGGDDLLSGGAGEDTLAGGEGDDKLHGGAKDDLLEGNSGSDTLLGGDGDDTLEGGGDADALWGGVGADSLYGGSGDDTAWGGAGEDTFRGSSGDDKLWGGAGSDVLDGGLGADTLGGGAGEDTLSGRAGKDALYGQKNADMLSGGAGGDVLGGGGGHDTLNGGKGEDTLGGGNGNDLLRGQNNADLLRGGVGRDTLEGGGGSDTLEGGSGFDRLAGGSHADSLAGGAGDDTLLGGRGHDVLNGRAEDDHLKGGAGNDTLIGGAGEDTFVFDQGDGADVIRDFQSGTDMLQFSAALTGGLTDARAILDQFAEVDGARTVFELGSGQTITLNGFEDVSALESDIFVLV